MTQTLPPLAQLELCTTYDPTADRGWDSQGGGHRGKAGQRWQVWWPICNKRAVDPCWGQPHWCPPTAEGWEVSDPGNNAGVAQVGLPGPG